MIQRMLAIWSLVPLPFLNPAWTSGSSQFMYCWSLAWRILSIILLAYEMTAISPFARSPGMEICCGPQNFCNSARTSLVYLFSSLWVVFLVALWWGSHAVPPRFSAARAQVPGAGHCWPVPLQEAALAQSLVGSLGPGVHKVLFEPSEHLWWVWGLILNAILPLLPTCWGFSFALGHGVSFWWDQTFSCQWLFSS